LSALFLNSVEDLFEMFSTLLRRRAAQAAAQEMHDVLHAMAWSGAEPTPSRLSSAIIVGGG